MTTKQQIVRKANEIGVAKAAKASPEMTSLANSIEGLLNQATRDVKDALRDANPHVANIDGVITTVSRAMDTLRKLRAVVKESDPHYR